MRAFAFALAISLGLGPAVRAVPPVRIASLNLCTDELVLTLAAPRQIMSVTHLSRDRRDSVLWRRARAYPANDGTILSVARYRPDLIVTMSGNIGDADRLAAALGARLITLPFPGHIADIKRAVDIISRAVGDPAKGQLLNQRIDLLQRQAPTMARNAVFVGEGGRTLATDGAGAEWLGVAGLRQIALPNQRIDRETLLRLQPVTLVESDYRADQYSRVHLSPIKRRADRHLRTDGRRWTCMGPTLIPEIERLRRIAAP